MSVIEYASDVNLSIDVVLKLCKKLGIMVEHQDDMLDDEAIIMLDNEVAAFNDAEVLEEDNLEENNEEYVLESIEEVVEEEPNQQNEVKI